MLVRKKHHFFCQQIKGNFTSGLRACETIQEMRVVLSFCRFVGTLMVPFMCFSKSIAFHGEVQIHRFSLPNLGGLADVSFKKNQSGEKTWKKKGGGFLIIETHGFFNSVNTHDHSITIGIHWDHWYLEYVLKIMKNQSNSLVFLPQIDHSIHLMSEVTIFWLDKGMSWQYPFTIQSHCFGGGALDSDSVSYVWWIQSISVNIQAGLVNEMNPKHILPVKNSHAGLATTLKEQQFFLSPMMAHISHHVPHRCAIVDQSHSSV